MKTKELLNTLQTHTSIWSASAFKCLELIHKCNLAKASHTCTDFPLVYAPHTSKQTGTDRACTHVLRDSGLNLRLGFFAVSCKIPKCCDLFCIPTKATFHYSCVFAPSYFAGKKIEMHENKMYSVLYSVISTSYALKCSLNNTNKILFH